MVFVAIAMHAKHCWTVAWKPYNYNTVVLMLRDFPHIWNLYWKLCPLLGGGGTLVGWMFGV
jgi:hypothetical protein